MRITDAAPVDWDGNIPFPTLSTAFARAAGTTGMRALFATDSASQALILIRSVPVPFCRQWTTRAKVYVSTSRSEFVTALVTALRARGVSYVRLGDAVWGGLSATTVSGNMTVTTSHLMTFDAALNESEALARMDSKTRAHLRKAIRNGVRVEEIRDESGLAGFCRLVEETRERMRARDVAAAAPISYFRAVFREMVSRGEALFLLKQ